MCMCMCVGLNWKGIVKRIFQRVSTILSGCKWCWTWQSKERTGDDENWFNKIPSNGMNQYLECGEGMNIFLMLVDGIVLVLVLSWSGGGRRGRRRKRDRWQARWYGRRRWTRFNGLNSRSLTSHHDTIDKIICHSSFIQCSPLTSSHYLIETNERMKHIPITYCSWSHAMFGLFLSQWDALN